MHTKQDVEKYYYKGIVNFHSALEFLTPYLSKRWKVLCKIAILRTTNLNNWLSIRNSFLRQQCLFVLWINMICFQSFKLPENNSASWSVSWVSLVTAILRMTRRSAIQGSIRNACCTCIPRLVQKHYPI